MVYYVNGNFFNGRLFDGNCTIDRVDPMRIAFPNQRANQQASIEEKKKQQ
jgi:hypothetical protein